MSKYSNGNHWVLLFGLAIGLATSAMTHAGQTKKLDLEAEAKQAAQEDATQAAERAQGIKGKYQRTFIGTMLLISDPSQNSAQQLSPEVMGKFITNKADKKPGREYLVKVDNNSKEVREKLKTFHGKVAEVTGKLRVIDENGEAKYLIVSSVIELAPTPPVKERGKLGGL